MSNSGFVNPRLSVVISSYNYARFLKECIESVLTQGYPGTEVIVVDDGSTDHSQEVIKSFGTAVTAIFKSNGGQSSSWNVGIAKASGDVIVLVDSDDRLVPGILHDYAKVFEAAGVVRCQGYTTVISEDGTLTGERVPESRPEELDLQQKVLSFGPGSYICTPTSGNAWSAAFLKQLLPLPESNVSGPDGLLFLAAPLYGKTVTVDRVSACFRIHESSVSYKISGLNAKNMRKTIKAYENHCEWLKFVAKSKSLVADQKTWDRKNWRIASLRYLLSKVEPNGASSQIWEHIGTIRGARTVKTRFLLFFFLLALRLAPLPQALWLANRKINLRHMPI